MTPAEPEQRRLAAIFSADVAGYSRLMHEDEAATVAALQTARRIFAVNIARCGGRVVDTAGDSVLAEFSSVVDALRCAVETQQAIEQRVADVPEPRRMLFRIGISLGDVLVDDDAIYGDGVNIAARVQTLAEPGEVCLSGVAYNQVKDKLRLPYEFIGKRHVKNINDPVPVYRVGSNRIVARSRPALGKRTAWIAGIGLVALIAVAIWDVFVPHFDATVTTSTGTPDQSRSSAVRSLVVLPFENMNQDPQQDYFSDGITDDLIVDLSRLSGLRVITRRQAFMYKNREANLQAVAEQLGVNYVVEGSVRRDADRVRVNVQLVDASTSTNLWAQRFDHSAQAIFDVQDEIRQKIIGALSLTLTEEEHNRTQRRYTASFAAYDKFLRGQSSLIKRASRADNADAREYMEEAIAIDPSFSRAHAALALTHADAFRFDWSEDPQGTAELAVATGERAVALDEQSPQAHWVLGYIYLFVLGDHSRAIEMAERAVRLAPHDSDGYTLLAVTYAFGGEAAKARLVIKQLVRTHPHYPSQVPSVLGVANLVLGSYAEALAAFDESLMINPSRVQANTYKAIVLYRLGRTDDAQWQVDQLYSLHPDFDVDVWAARQPFKDQTITKQLVADLRAAGVD